MDAELLQQLVKILSNHCGETGENEGAVQTLNRIIKDAEKYHKLNLCNECEQVNKYGIYEGDKDVHKYEDCPDPYKCDIHIGVGEY